MVEIQLFINMKIKNAIKYDNFLGFLACVKNAKFTDYSRDLMICSKFSFTIFLLVFFSLFTRVVNKILKIYELLLMNTYK